MRHKLTKTLLIMLGIFSSNLSFAQGFNFTDAFKISQSLPQIGNLIDSAGPSLDFPIANIKFTDGSIHTISSLDGTTTLRTLLNTSNATFLFDGKQVKLTTSALGFNVAYNNSDQTYKYTIETVVETRPWQMVWTGKLDQISSTNTFEATINGNQVTLILPPGESLKDLNGSTVITILDANGNKIIDGQSLSSISSEEAMTFATKIGVIGVDMALRGAQQQAMAQNYSLITDQIDFNMLPTKNSGVASKDGLIGWVGAQFQNISGNVRGTSYDGDSRTSMVGFNMRKDNILLGIAIGDSNVNIMTSSNGGSSNLGGTVISPYGAIALNGGNLVIDGVLQYQDLNGDAMNRTLASPIRFDGNRWGYRVAGTYYIPQSDIMTVGLTTGGAYLNDDLTGTYLGMDNDYSSELGKLFIGAKIYYRINNATLVGSAIYNKDITAKIDNAANVFSSGKEGYMELKFGANWELAPNLNANLTARTSIMNSDMKYYGIQGRINYKF